MVIADRLWRDRFGGDPAAVGATLTIDDADHLVVGIAPPGFAFPEPDIAVYTPLVIPRTDVADRAIGIMTAVARLAPGVNAARAEVEGTAFARAASRPFANLIYGEGGPVEVRVRLRRAEDESGATRAARAVGRHWFSAADCLRQDVANLLLSRASDRTREMAIRAALGAGRLQLLRQLLVESLILAMAGGVLGIGVAWTLTRAVPRLARRAFRVWTRSASTQGFFLSPSRLPGWWVCWPECGQR